MVCGEVRRIVYFFLDGQLGARVQKDVTTHLSLCPDCASGPISTAGCDASSSDDWPASQPPAISRTALSVRSARFAPSGRRKADYSRTLVRA
jgi:putative zinc finger protein